MTFGTGEPVLGRWAVFLDRDGTVNAHVVRAGRRSSPWRIGEFALVPGAVAASEVLRGAGARLFVVTNQPDLQRGLLHPRDLEGMHHWLQEMLGLDHVYVCPHVKSQRCKCRKPAGTLFRRAIEEFGVDLRHSWMVGDRATDAQAALTAGLRAVITTPARRSARSTVPGLTYVTSMIDGAREILRAREDDRDTNRSRQWS